MEIPEIEIHHLELETDAEIDFRGVGEGGAIIAPAAVANAVEDALAPFEVTIDTFPLTPTGSSSSSTSSPETRDHAGLDRLVHGTRTGS